MQLSPREVPHLVQNCENICTQNIWRVQYLVINCLAFDVAKINFNIKVAG